MQCMIKPKVFLIIIVLARVASMPTYPLKKNQSAVVLLKIFYVFYCLLVFFSEQLHHTPPLDLWRLTLGLEWKYALKSKRKVCRASRVNLKQGRLNRLLVCVF